MTNASTTNTAQAGGMPTLSELFPIPDAIHSLDRLLGTWRVEGTLTVGENPLRLDGRWEFTAAAAGWGIKAALRADVEGMGAYVEDDLLGYDVETQTFHIYSLTNSGAVHDHVARWTGADVFELTYDGLQDGKPYHEEGRVTFIPGGQMQIVSRDFVAGELASSMDVTLRR
jgi:hypothetical protein